MSEFNDPIRNPGFITKDSGKREEFVTGMVRDTQDDKPRYDLLDIAFLKRWAQLMARGAKKYGENNWKKAATPEELARFKASAVRHMFQWLEGDISEDHAAAVAFNLAGAEMVKTKLDIPPSLTDIPCSDGNIGCDPCDSNCHHDLPGGAL